MFMIEFHKVDDFRPNSFHNRLIGYFFLRKIPKTKNAQSAEWESKYIKHNQSILTCNPFQINKLSQNQFEVTSIEITKSFPWKIDEKARENN